MGDSSPIVFSMFTTTSHLNDTHALQWSVDDNICLLTDKGAIVFAPDFTFSDSSTSLYPHKHFIPNPSESDPLAIQSTAKRFIDNQRPECDWFDHIHLTKGFALNYAKYQLSAWSPRVAQFGSLLALLTYDNRLTIYFSEANKWKLLADCTKILDAEIGSHYKGVPLVKAFEHLHKLSINCMAWSPVFEESGDESIILVCCTSSGHCHFLKFLFTGRNASISLINSWRTGLDSIVFCEWYKEYLAICPLNGQFIVIKISVRAITPEYDDWLMTPKVVPWREIDDMPVQNIIFLEIEQGRYKIFFSKNCHIFIATMKEMVVARKTMLQLCGITVVETLVKTSITGLSLSPDNDLIFSSPDRLLTILHINDDSKQLDQTPHPINSDEVVSNLTPLGLRTSRNRVLTCLAQTMTKLHDHLLLVEPTRIIIFPNLSFDAVTNRIEMLVEDSNLYSKYSSLREIMDLLNALRGYYANNLNWIPKILEKLLDGKWDSDALILRSINLKILRFISLACIQRTPNNRTVTEYEDAVIHLEELILLEHVKFIHDEYWNQRHTLTRNQVVSLATMASWAGKHNLTKATWTNHDSSLETEKCPICGENVSIENFKEGLCPKNHRFGRCINSLLICDLISIKYEFCKLCGRSLYSVPNIWQNYVECLFCH